MIGRLRGVVAEVGEEEVLIDVLGVGYVVRCGTRALGRLTAGEEALIHVESTWSEAAGPRLYGFLSREERGAFVALQAIQGVGPKAALAVLDVLTPGELAGAAARDDKAAVARASGVGPKLAARITAELKSRPIGAGLVAAQTGAAASHAPPGPAAEATAALLGLGVAELAARRAVEVALVRVGEGAASEPSVGALIKAALQVLGQEPAR